MIFLSPSQRIILSQEAQSVFLNDPEALIAHYCVPSQDDDENQEEETNTVIPPHLDNPQDPQKREENAQAQDEVTSQRLSPQNYPQNSPQNSQTSSKTTKLMGKSYQAWKMRINITQ